MIKLRELHITNFRSWKKLDLTLDNRGLLLISGDNGSGKSSIRTALEYLLTDKTSDNLPLEDLSFNKEGDCVLSCILEQDGNKIEIIKYRDHNQFNNKTVLLVNDTDDRSHSDRRETQREIENLLDINSYMLQISSLFSQHSKSFPDSPESDRKNILYSIIPFERYNELFDYTKSIILDIEDEISANVHDIEYTIDKINEKENDIEDFYNENKLFEEKKLNKIKELKQTRETIYFEKSSLNISLLKYNDARTKLTDSIKDINKVELSEYEDKLNIVDNELQKLKQDRLFSNNKLKSSSDCECPILSEECDRLKEKKDLILSTLEPKLFKLDKSISIKAKHKINITNKIDDINNKITHNEKIEENIKDMEIENRNNQLLYNTKLESVNEKIKMVEEENNPYSKLLDEYRKILTLLMKDFSLSEKNEKHWKKEHKLYSFWMIAFSKSGIPNIKAESYLEKIEQLTNYYLSKISDNTSVKIASQSTLKSSSEIREKISYKIISPYKKIENYHSFSEGQKQRIKIADVFAFNKLIGKLNILILDEILELSLDEVGKDCIFNLITEKAKELDSLIVISNSEQLKSKFDNVIDIEIKNGVSYVR